MTNTAALDCLIEALAREIVADYLRTEAANDPAPDDRAENPALPASGEAA